MLSKLWRIQWLQLFGKKYVVDFEKEEASPFVEWDKVIKVIENIFLTQYVIKCSYGNCVTKGCMKKMAQLEG